MLIDDAESDCLDHVRRSLLPRGAHHRRTQYRFKSTRGAAVKSYSPRWRL